MIIDINATKDEIVEVLLISLENLIEIKLKENKEQESSKIKEFMEKYKVSAENVLGIVAEDIIGYNKKLSEKKSYEHAEQQSTLKQTQPISDTLSNLSLIGVSGPANSLNNVSVHNNLTQVRRISSRTA